MSSLRIQKYEETLLADDQCHAIKDSHLDSDETKSEHYKNLVSSLNGQIINSLHNGNWIFLNKRQLNNYHTIDNSAENTVIEPDNINDPSTNTVTNSNSQNKMNSHLADIQTRVSEKLEQSLKNQSIRSFVSDTQKLKDLSDFFLENLFRLNETTAAPAPRKEDQSFSASIRSLTSSSCHSERSVAHLNCLTCFDDESKASENLIDLSDVNMFASGLKDDSDLGSLVQSTLDEVCSRVVSEDDDDDDEVSMGGDDVPDLVNSMLQSVDEEASIEKEVYGILLELVREIEIRFAVEEALEASCANVEACEAMIGKITASVQSEETCENNDIVVDEEVEKEKEVLKVEVEDDLEEDKCQLNNSKFSTSLNKIVKGKRFCLFIISWCCCSSCFNLVSFGK